MSRRDRSSQRGSATVLALPLLGALTVAAVLLAFVGGAVGTRRRVAAAADLAALAGASAIQHGRDGCAAASVIAARNGAALDSCVVQGAMVLVRAHADTASLLGRSLTVSARAKAGPASG